MNASASFRRVIAARTTAAVLAAAVVSLAAPAGATALAATALSATAAPSGTAAPSAAATAANSAFMTLHPMPVVTARFSRHHGRLIVHVAGYGLTPGSAHAVDLVRPDGRTAARFSRLTANGVGQAHETLTSSYARRVPHATRLVIRMGAHAGRIASLPIAVSGRLSRGSGFWRVHRLSAVEVASDGRYFGTPRGHAAVVYNARRHTLTVTVTASGVTPGPHAAHIHVGSCQRQGPVLYMLRDLIANHRGRIVHAVRVFTHITSPIPASGWYLNIHQGTSTTILRNGAPTIYFRPLICANIRPRGRR